MGVVAVEVPQIQFLDDEMVGYCWAWYLVRQWIRGLRQLLGAFGWFLHIFYVLVFSDCEVAPVHSRCFSCFPELATFLKLDTFFTSPLKLAVPCSLLWCTLQDAMLGSTVETCYASAPGAFGR